VSTATLELREVGFSFGPRTVLAAASVTVAAGEPLAVVGPNGAGKSTLLRLMAGLEQPGSGQLSRNPPDATVALLPQERDRRDDETLRAYLGRRTGVAAAEASLEAASTELAAGAAGADDFYASALERYLSVGGPDLDRRAPAVLAELGLDEALLDQPTTTLSGGELARSALAGILLTQVDVLLLDEPTNDLDAAGLTTIEGFLAARSGGLVVVSHDRAFLEKVAADVLEIDPFTARTKLFGGGFSSYLEERERERAAAKEAFEDYDEQRRSLAEKARREKEWARQGTARATSAKVRREEPDTFVRARWFAGAQSRGAAASRTLRALGRLGEVDDPRDPWQLKLTLQPGSRSGDDVAGLVAAVVQRGTFTLGPVDLDISRGERVAISGPNGSGKSTLLGALLGRVPLVAGRQWVGRSVVLGEIDQARRSFATEDLLTDAFRAATRLDEPDARTLLAKFGLGADEVLRPIGTLSPGERTRVDLALLMARQANLLVLDEPTNHLDLPAIEQLEEALGTYDGTLLLVSHDRRLMERVAISRHLLVEDGRVREQR